MAKKEQQTEKKEPNKRDITEFRRSPNFVSIYSNNTLWGYSKFDFQMVCGRAEVSRDKEHQAIEETAIILMTPEHAKLILNDLAGMIANYEKEHGEIKIRPKE